MKNTVIVLLAVLLAAAPLLADDTYVFQNPQQETSAAPSSTTNLVGATSPFSLFDMSRLHMQQSYSLSFFSSGGHSASIAMYLNQIDYDVTKTLRLSVGVAWLHQPQATLGFSEQTVSNRLLPSFSIDWRPSDKFQLRVDYRSLAPYYDYFNGRFYRPYGAPIPSSAWENTENKE